MKPEEQVAHRPAERWFDTRYGFRMQFSEDCMYEKNSLRKV